MSKKIYVRQVKVVFRSLVLRLLLLGLLLFLTGCAQAEIHYELYDYGFEVRNFVALETESPQGQALLQELLAYWREAGFRSQAGILETQAGARKTVPAQGFAETVTLFREYLQAESPFSEAQVTYKGGLFISQFSATLNLDLREPLSPDALAALPSGEQQELADILSQEQPKLVIGITLPGRVTATNGQVSHSQGRSTVKWPLRLGEENQIQIRAITPNPLPLFLAALIIVFGLCQLLLYLLFRKRRRTLSL
jgi:hypothetical protein